MAVAREVSCAEVSSGRDRPTPKYHRDSDQQTPPKPQPVVCPAPRATTGPRVPPKQLARRASTATAAHSTGRFGLDGYLQQIGAAPILTREEEYALGTRARAGDEEAVTDLVRANLRFVVSVAKPFAIYAVPLDDLIAEGNAGLLRAARKFDPDRGVKFISYAVWWIRQAILQAIAEQGRAVRIPLNRSMLHYRTLKTAGHLAQRLGRVPTPHEVAAETGLSLPEVQAAMAGGAPVVRLDAPLSPDGHSTLSDLLPDHGAQADTLCDDTARVSTIATAVEKLSPREGLILRLYYGLGEEDEMTLEEIGARLGVTRERVRQIKEKALTHLRVGGAGRLLRAYREA
jgi:RNA polymerase primary sigma factor